MKQMTKRGLWLIVSGASWTLIIVSGLMAGMGNIEFFIMSGVLSMVATTYGAFYYSARGWDGSMPLKKSDA